MKKGLAKCCTLIVIFCLGLFSAIPHSHAQQPLVRMEIPSSPNPVGSGARALGMGGAFIAIADDATAASWNPGGLIQLEKPEISAVGSYVSRSEDNKFGNNPEASGTQRVGVTSLNYLSAAYPFKAYNHNMIVSLNYQRLYDFNREWNFNVNFSNPIFTSPVMNNYKQTGALYALGLAYSLEITPSISAGITLNYWGDSINRNRWEQTYAHSASVSAGSFPGTYSTNKTESYAFQGYNAVLGFLWRMGEHWTLGGVFKTPFLADVTHNVNSMTSQAFPTFPTANSASTSSNRYDENLQMPMSYGLGVAYRFSDRFTLSGDIYRTQWNDFMYKNYQGVKTSPISGKSEASSRIDATNWVRFGGEYLIIRDKYVVPLRAGIFYDPAPAESSPDDYYGFAVGTGISYGRFVFDIAYQFRFGNNVGTSTLQGMNFSQNVQEHTVYSSLIIHF